MAAVVVPSMSLGASQSAASATNEFPPVAFVYEHLHDSIRAELAKLSSDVQSIERILQRGEDVTERLVRLRERYQMLVQVNRYHSSVEDEIVYPAVEYKVQNVTHPYSVEHGEEDILLDSLQNLIDQAIKADASERDGFAHELCCKVEEVHVTMQKHLRKEEDQLFPLLLQHFTFSEQADLVVQFICCIPVMSARSVLNWLRQSTVSHEEQVALRQHVALVTVDPHLRRLLTHWLQPTSQSAPVSVTETVRSGSGPQCFRARSACSTGHTHPSTKEPTPEPLDTLVLLHRGLLHTLEALTCELQELAVCGRVSAKQIQSVVQRWQFLCTVSAFHRVSEDEFVFPMARALGVENSAAHCAHEHWGEAQSLTKLGRSLSELESCTRRNAANVSQLLKDTVALAHDVSAAMKMHLAREEQDVLPALRKHLSRSEKHAIVWKSLQALPLRLLERIMPWVALHIGTQGLSELMRHPAEGEDPVGDTVLVQLLSKWSQRAFSVAGPTSPSPPSSPLSVVVPPSSGNMASPCAVSPQAMTDGNCPMNSNTGECLESHLHVSTKASKPWESATGAGSGQPGSATAGSTLSPPHSPVRLHDDPHLAFHISTCAPALVRLADPHSRGARGAASARQPGGAKRKCCEENTSADCVAGVGSENCVQKRARTSTDCCAHTNTRSVDHDQQDPPHNPIDHIFQFHKAFRRELHQIEIQARNLQTVCQELQESGEAFDIELQRLSGRFHFVQSLYLAHSVSEDEVLFPALEAKHTLRNVSKFYVLDHEHEGQLFAELETIIHRLHELVKLRPSSSVPHAEREAFRSNLSGVVSKMRLKVASVRASLETHVKAEEAEIWPLFSEHFTIEEQSTLVGTIIGRTGAVVLQALIPWVMNSFSHDETLAMMDSLRSAAKNTRFDRWLEVMVPSGSSVPPADVEADVDLVADRHAPECQSHAAGMEAGPVHAGHSSKCAHASTEDVVPHAAASSQLDPEASGCSTAVTRTPVPAAVCALDVPRTAQHGDCGAGIAAAAQYPPVPNVLHRPSEKDCSEYRPGWVDIFRMNASQLESAAVQYTPNDKDRDRDSYLAHHLMVSRFLIAQQRMHPQASGSATSSQQLLNAGPSVQSTCTSATHTHALTGAPGGCALPSGVPMGAAALPRSAPEAASSGSCMHYKKKCNVIAPCCNAEVACRLCHDEQLPCDQEMDRYKVTEMVCQACGKKQPCAQHCSDCGMLMARYFCSVCNLFDDTEDRDIYHCPFCNMCRRGKGLGIDAFHCMQCNACMSLDLFNNHTCREHAMESKCPICREDLFESSSPVKELPCGHLMHSSCFMEHMQHRYTCPICFKTAGDLTLYFQMLDRLLSHETMPDQLAKLTQNVKCNDCSNESTVKYHFVYHKCPSCSSYNTRVL